MAEQSQEQNRTEPATPFKLREARRRGQVMKSMEVNSFFILLTALTIFYFIGEKMVTSQLSISRSLFSQAHQVQFGIFSLVGLLELIVDEIIGVYWPLISAIMIIGILANFFQTGPIFSFFPLKPDVQRLNPVQGFKRIFSLKLLFESVKTVIKLSLFAAVIYFVFISLIPSLLSLIDSSPDIYAAYLLTHVRELMFKLIMVLLLIALFDFMYTKWDFSKKMRMSRRELKEEVKRREGDPQIRAKIRELQKEAVKRAGALRKVPDADVLITNPTHLAIALRYERDVMRSPQVIAKGANELAAKMRKVAKKHNIPIVENKPLAKKLFRKVEIDHGIPEDLYPYVAKILVWVYTMKGEIKKYEKSNDASRQGV